MKQERLAKSFILEFKFAVFIWKCIRCIFLQNYCRFILSLVNSSVETVLISNIWTYSFNIFRFKENTLEEVFGYSSDCVLNIFICSHLILPVSPCSLLSGCCWLCQGTPARGSAPAAAHLRTGERARQRQGERWKEGEGGSVLSFHPGAADSDSG